VTILFDHLVELSGVARNETPVPATHVSYLLQTYYDVTGTLTRVPAQKDETFFLDTPFSRLVVKLSSSWEAPDLVDLQTSAMRHVARRDPGLPIQRLCPTRAGLASHPVPLGDGPYPRTLRVLTYAPGEALAGFRPTEAQFATLGDTLARLTLALADFDHPRADRPSVWDLEHFPQLEPLLAHVPDAHARSLIERVLADYNREVTARSPWLERQVCQSGFNSSNVMVDPTRPEFVTGIIDFGDTCRTAVAFDLAIGLAAQFALSADPWRGALLTLKAFRRQRELAEEDLAAAIWAAPARQATRMLLAAYQRATDPDGSSWLAGHGYIGADLLEAVLDADPAKIVRATLAA
jgi:Ser/Thr protein kinase RdoA (MazF antagonist)